uniref:Acyl-CoA_dh_M domain-containing protein n=1 Tax=Syphacia muris TaxID=451379 RepID=A0A0N5AMV0_9BILA
MNRVWDLMEVLDTYDQGLSNRYFLSTGVFCLALLTMGTQRHHDLIQKCIDNKVIIKQTMKVFQIIGCFCLTELGHGSNIRDIETECHFENGHFVLNTPNISAIKCWAGNLSYSATHSIVYAQLYINGECKGLHAFSIQIRDVHTLKPLPGITIGDIGEKAGEWNGIENGWMKFDNYKIPLETLLNRTSDVTANGKFIQTNMVTALAMQFSAVIAIRYSAVRTHFTKDKRKCFITV